MKSDKVILNNLSFNLRIDAKKVLKTQAKLIENLK